MHFFVKHVGHLFCRTHNSVIITILSCLYVIESGQAFLCLWHTLCIHSQSSLHGMFKLILDSRVIQGSGGCLRGRRADGAETKRQEGVHGSGDPQTGAAQLRGHPLHPPPGAQVSPLCDSWQALDPSCAFNCAYVSIYVHGCVSI